MKKAFLILSAALLLASCDGLFNAKTSDETAQNDSISTQNNANHELEYLDISVIPETAELQDSFFQYVVYVNVEQEPNEDDPEGVYSVWWGDERTGVAYKVLTTNPMAIGQWEKMEKEGSNAVDVPIDQVAAASRAYIASEDASKIIVEGCPDARNIWTYIIDVFGQTAKQLPSTEGVQDLDWKKGEVIVASYGYYPEGGRYTYNKAYSLDGKYLRQTSEPEVE